uniref:Uncharacterized protein n=1 Tax=Arundo donax TaxID=35708 RepID=A0A0A8ZBZ2_ARUDO
MSSQKEIHVHILF